MKRVARAWAELMRRLGYERYGAQGGDSAPVSPDLGRVDPEHVVGVHVNAATVGFIPLGPTTDEDLATLSDVENNGWPRSSTSGPRSGATTCSRCRTREDARMVGLTING